MKTTQNTYTPFNEKHVGKCIIKLCSLVFPELLFAIIENIAEGIHHQQLKYNDPLQN